MPDPDLPERAPRDLPKFLNDMDELGALEEDMEEVRPAGNREELADRVTTWTVEHNLVAVQDLHTSVTSELDFDRVVRAVLDQAIRIMGAERGMLFLGRQDAGGLVPVLAVNMEGAVLPAVEKVGRTILAAGSRGQTIVTQDALTDPRFSEVAGVHLNEMHSVLCTPLMTRGGQLGALYLDARRPHAFPPRLLGLFDVIAGVAAVAIENARLYGDLQRDLDRVRTVDRSVGPLDRVIGGSEGMVKLRRQLEVAALLDQPVLVLGEPGSGRRFLARALHDAGRRAHQPFVAMDCTAVAGRSLRGVIMGRSGAAVRDGQAAEGGLITEANHGTLYLGECQHLDEDTGEELARLLRVRAYRPMGSRQDDRVDFRLVLAMPPVLTGESPGGGLVPALADGVRDLRLIIPPLRERPGDIPALVAAFIHEHASATGAGGRIAFTPGAIEALQKRAWPGNVRELQAVVQRVLFYRPGPIIDANLVAETLSTLDKDEAGALGPWSGRILPLRAWEDEAIRRALIETNGNRLEAAKLLGLHRNTMLNRLKMKKPRRRKKAETIDPVTGEPVVRRPGRPRKNPLPGAPGTLKQL